MPFEVRSERPSLILNCWTEDLAVVKIVFPILLEMKIVDIILIVVLVILIIWILRWAIVQKMKPRRQKQSSRYHRTDTHSQSDTESTSDSSDNEEEHPVHAPHVEVKTEEVKSSRRSKPSALPTFDRPQAPIDKDRYVSMSDAGYRFEVSATAKLRNHVKNNNLPKNFSAMSEWPSMITGVFDQERCGSCWAQSCGSMLSDRIRIKSKGKFLKNGDYISPFAFAACVKCGKDGACPRVCEGNYLDDVLQYMVDTGAVAQSDIDKYSKQGEEYLCFDYAKYSVKPWKGIKKYRVNVFPPSMLNEPEALAINEQAMMEEIYNKGPIVVILKVFVPMDSRNFYLHKEGIYGYGWKSEPTETDGYHAISIIGWGEDEKLKDSNGKSAKYWIIRNSWGENWGQQGLARILKGVNFGMIEADCWTIDPDITGH